MGRKEVLKAKIPMPPETEDTDVQSDHLDTTRSLKRAGAGGAQAREG
jgi:hypothetical protein